MALDEVGCQVPVREPVQQGNGAAGYPAAVEVCDLARVCMDAQLRRDAASAFPWVPVVPSQVQAEGVAADAAVVVVPVGEDRAWERARVALGTCGSRGACGTRGSLFSRGALVSSHSLDSLDALVPFEALDSLVTLNALDSLETLVPLDALEPVDPLDSLNALLPLGREQAPRRGGRRAWRPAFRSPIRRYRARLR